MAERKWQSTCRCRLLLHVVRAVSRAAAQYLERHLASIQDDPSRTFLSGGCVTVSDLLVIAGACIPQPALLPPPPSSSLLLPLPHTSLHLTELDQLQVPDVHVTATAFFSVPDIFQAAAFNLFDFQPYPAVPPRPASQPHGALSHGAAGARVDGSSCGRCAELQAVHGCCGRIRG
jgi:hypothetical protein